MERKKKNILVIIPNLYGGGAERVATLLADHLEEIYEVKIVTFEKSDGKDYVYKHNSELICLNLPGGNDPIKKISTLIKRVFYLRKIKKELNIDTSISFLDSANIVNALSKRGEKVITSVRSLLSARSSSLFYKASIKIISLLSSSVVTLSEMVKLDLIENFGINDSKVITIYNPCDIKMINHKIEENDKLTKEIIESYKNVKYIVTMGRLVRPKGHWHLLRAFKVINDIDPRTRLIILGEGDLKCELERLAKELNIDQYVFFLGFVSNPFKIISSCDVFVFSSIYEGLGNAIIEALACKKAVVSTDCDAGPREILSPETSIKKKTDVIEYAQYGILVPSFPIVKEIDFSTKISVNERNLANAISTLLNDEELRLSYEKQAYARAFDFSVEKIMDKWINLIEYK